MGIRFGDYRDLVGVFDRVYSFGMFEHLNARHHAVYLAKVRKLLTLDGLSLLHTIGSRVTLRANDPWMEKYIFPNSIIPSGAQIAKVAEHRMVIEDWHDFGVDHDKTLLALCHVDGTVFRPAGSVCAAHLARPGCRSRHSATLVPSAMSASPLPSVAVWAQIRPSLAKELTHARLQAHHCVQFASAMGLSYLSPADDDSHTSLTWDAGRAALMSHSIDRVSLGVRLADLVLVLARAGLADVELPTHGRTINELCAELRVVLGEASLEPDRYSLRRHFAIPTHPVALGAPFDASDSAAFGQLARWFGNAAGLLGAVGHTHGGSDVACWPHHFDVATLIAVSPGRTTGVGLVPGDMYYDEPYFYVNAHPQPSPSSLVDALTDGARWHTFEWIGAVLPASALAEAAELQGDQARAFIDSALASLRRTLNMTSG